MSILTLSSANLLADGSTYRFQFATTTQLQKKMIALAQAQIYFSWPNISAYYGDNVFTYTWADGTVVSVTVPDGGYAVSDLNNYLQSVMLANNHYLINSSGGIVFYLQLRTNSTFYSVEIDVLPLPATLPTGWTVPSGATWLFSAVASKNMQFTIPTQSSSVKFPTTEWFGILPGTYPPTLTYGSNYAKLSDFTPEVSPVSSVLINCNLVTNTLAPNCNTLFSLSPEAVVYGGVISVAAQELLWLPLNDCAAQYLDITLTDQNNQPLPFKDPYSVFVLYIKDRTGFHV